MGRLSAARGTTLSEESCSGVGTLQEDDSGVKEPLWRAQARQDIVI